MLDIEEYIHREYMIALFKNKHYPYHYCRQQIYRYVVIQLSKTYQLSMYLQFDALTSHCPYFPSSVLRQ
jgi:hypothetical protein